MNLTPGIETLPNGQWVVAGDTHFTVWAKQKGHIVTDPHLLGFLAGVIPPRSVVWDIGACIGDHTFAYLANGNTVVAFEPHPISFRCLEHNCPSAQCLNIAASDKAGSLNFMALDNVGASRIHPDGEWSVPAMALDDIPGLPAPGFVKIDCEGVEPNVIVGMAGTITRHRPILFVEMNPSALAIHGFTVEGLREQIESLGYTAAALYPPRATWQDEQFDVVFLPQ